MIFNRSKIIVSFLLLISISFSPLFVLPNKADAQVASVIQGCTSTGASLLGGGASMAASAVSSVVGLVVPTSNPDIVGQVTTDAGNSTWLNIKEGCLDSIVWAVAKIILREMTQSIVRWINTGFQGDPLFLTNPEGYFAGLANREFNRVIYSIQNSGSVYAQQVVRSLVMPPRQKTFGQTITSNCVARQAVATNNSQIASDYQAGDYSTRIAQEDNNDSQTFLTKISNFGRKTLANVGFSQLAQVGEADSTYTDTGEGTGAFDQGQFTNSDVGLGPSYYCPTNQTEQNTAVSRCMAGTLSSRQCGGLSGFEALSKDNPINAILNANIKISSQQGSKVGQAKDELAQSGGFLSVRECTQYAVDEENNPTTTCEPGHERITTPGAAVANSLKEMTASSFRQAELVNEIGQAVDMIMNSFFNQMLNMGVSELRNAIGGQAGNTAGNIISGAYAGYSSQAEFDSAIRSNLNRVEITAIRFRTVKSEIIPILRNIASSLSQLSGSGCPSTKNSAYFDLYRINQFITIANQYETHITAITQNLATLNQIRNSTAGSATVSTAYSQLIQQLPDSNDVTSIETEKIQMGAKKTQVDGYITACQAEIEAILETERQRLEALNGGNTSNTNNGTF